MSIIRVVNADKVSLLAYRLMSLSFRFIFYIHQSEDTVEKFFFSGTDFY